MACRHLNIRFLDSGDVEYNFFRHHSKTMLYRYLIEWPAEQIEILGGQCLKDHNFRRSVTKDGFLLLEWDRVPDLGRGVNYVKRGYLTHPSGEPELWQYSEQFNIKLDFSLHLHSPWERINAIQRRSTARFCGIDGHERSFLPRDLVECVFRSGGVLSIHWILETLEKPRKQW